MNLKTKSKNTALIVAVAMNHVDVVKVLVEGGANIHTTKSYPLKLAEDLGNSESAEILRDAGAKE